MTGSLISHSAPTLALYSEPRWPPPPLYKGDTVRCLLMRTVCSLLSRSLSPAFLCTRLVSACFSSLSLLAAAAARLSSRRSRPPSSRPCVASLASLLSALRVSLLASPSAAAAAAHGTRRGRQPLLVLLASSLVSARPPLSARPRSRLCLLASPLVSSRALDPYH